MIRAFQNFLDEMNIPSSFVDQQRTMIQFSIGNINYLFQYRAEDDPEYIRIMIPEAGTLDIQNIETLRILYNLTTMFKLGKAYVENNHIWFVVEAFIYDRSNTTMLFQRMISVLRDMFNHFRTHNNG